MRGSRVRKPSSLSGSAQICIRLQERARNGQAHRAGLAIRAAAVGVDRESKAFVLFATCNGARTAFCKLTVGKYSSKRFAVHFDFAAARRHADAGDGGLAAARGDEFLAASAMT